jgi:formamidopyrimidine-DNA glycosylase
MPEFPDIQIYVEALDRTVVGGPLRRVRLGSPFLVRSIDPPLDRFLDRKVTGASRLGTRIVLEFEGEYFLIVHLMIAGRLRWKKAGAKLPGRAGLAAFDFDHGTLMLTEAGTKRRASLYAVQGRSALEVHDRGGADVLRCTVSEFGRRLASGNHTLKRSLCDPTLFSGIGNAYSDEILHGARLSPFKLTSTMQEDEVRRLHRAAKSVLGEWVARLREECGTGFPDKVTAFHRGMAVHGKYREPCPVCSTPVQRIVHSDNEANYCPTCQTDGKLLKDRALSRLLGADWPRSIDEMESYVEQRRQ